MRGVCIVKQKITIQIDTFRIPCPRKTSTSTSWFYNSNGIVEISNLVGLDADGCDGVEVSTIGCGPVSPGSIPGHGPSG